MDNNFKEYLKRNDLLDWYYNFDKKERNEIINNLKDIEYFKWEKVYMFECVIARGVRHENKMQKIKKIFM